MTKTTPTGMALFTIVRGEFRKARIIQNGRLVEVQLQNKAEYRQLLQQLSKGS